MNDMARVIRSEGGQAVELPEGYRFDGAEVRITREGERVVLEPAKRDAVIAVDPETGLTTLELDRLIVEGLEGPDELWDVEQLKRDFRERFEAERATR